MDILTALERSSRRTLASNSGSVPGGRNERIQAGQSYLYKLRGMESEVLEFRLFEKVHGDALNRALHSSLNRFPYVDTKALEVDGDFYIVQNPVSMTARHSKCLASLGSLSCGHHLVDITYWDRSIYISFHHALCDGRGIMPFAETLIWTYFEERRQYSEPEDGACLPGDPLPEGLAYDPFFQDFGPVEEVEELDLPKEGYHLVEGDEEHGGTSWRYELVFERDDFLSKMKEVHATPAIFANLLMSRAILSVNPDADKPVKADTAFDMRHALGCDETFKNCVSTLILPYYKDSSVEEVVSSWRDLMDKQRSPARCRNSARMIRGLFEKLDSLEGYEAKQSMMGFFEGMALDTFILSYLGRIRLGGNAEKVESIHLYNSGTKGLGANMIDSGRRITVDIKQSFPSDAYAKAFKTEAEAMGLSPSLSPAIEFTTPCDSLIRRK